MKQAKLFAIILLVFPFFVNAQIFVNQQATGSNDGSSWQDAYAELRDAIQNAPIGAEIWVARGTYFPSATGNTTESFVISNSLSLYGGFAGTEITLQDRVLGNNPTILSGDYNGDDIVTVSTNPLTITFQNRSDNAERIIDALGAVGTITIDGFTIESGEGNSSTGAGATFASSTGNITVNIQNCTFRNNNVNNARAGALRFSIGSGFSLNAVVTNTSFINNAQNGSDGKGGAIWGTGPGEATTTYINCLFKQNRSERRGGAITNDLNYNCTYINCIFDENRSGAGGATLETTALPTFYYNCTFHKNSANIGPAIYNLSDSALHLYNCIFYDNDGLPESALLGNSFVTAHNVFEANSFSDMLPNIPGAQDLGGNLFAVDPLFADVTQCDFSLSAGSPAIDAGDNNLVQSATDFTDRINRIVNGQVDMGALENPCGSASTLDSLSFTSDQDLFIDGVGFANNANITFTDTNTPAGAVLYDISLELYFKLNGNSCENEIAIQLTDPAGNTQTLTAYNTCNGGTGLYYVNLNIPSVQTTGLPADWLIEFDDTNDQNTDYEYSVRFARLNYKTIVGGTITTNQVDEISDMDLFIDGVGFTNNPNMTFTDPATPSNAILSNISLELYFKLNGNSCENEIALQITDPAGNTYPLTAYTTCNGGTGLYYVNLPIPAGSTTGNLDDWIIEFDDTNDQNTDYEYSVRFGRLTYTAIHATGGMPITTNETVSDYVDTDLFIDAVGFANNYSYTFIDPATPSNAILSNISLELYFKLNGSSCENEIALQVTDPAGNTYPMTAYTTCNGGTGLYYVNLNVPIGNTTGSVANWLVEFDDTNDQNADYEYSVRFGRLTYDTEYIECVPIMMSKEDIPTQDNFVPTHKNLSTSSQDNTDALNIYPIPVSQYLNVEYFSENSDPMNIEIFSNEGKILMSRKDFLTEGLNTMQINVEKLPVGHYYLRMYNTDKVDVQTFIKIAP